MENLGNTSKIKIEKEKSGDFWTPELHVLAKKIAHALEEIDKDQPNKVCNSLPGHAVKSLWSENQTLEEGQSLVSDIHQNFIRLAEARLQEAQSNPNGVSQTEIDTLLDEISKHRDKIERGNVEHAEYMSSRPSNYQILAEEYISGKINGVPKHQIQRQEFVDAMETLINTSRYANELSVPNSL